METESDEELQVKAYTKTNWPKEGSGQEDWNNQT